MSNIISSVAAAQKARREFLAKWQRIEPVWHDARAAAFRQEYLVPLEPALRQAMEAITEASAMIDQAQRDCE